MVKNRIGLRDLLERFAFEYTIRQICKIRKPNQNHQTKTEGEHANAHRQTRGESPDRDPKKLHDALGLEAGDYLEVEIYEGGKLLVTPKDLVDRHPEIDKRLAEAEGDIKAGRVKGPFTTADDAIKALRGRSKKK